MQYTLSRIQASVEDADEAMRPVCKSCNGPVGMRLVNFLDRNVNKGFYPPGVSGWCHSPPCSISRASPDAACYASCRDFFLHLTSKEHRGHTHALPNPLLACALYSLGIFATTRIGVGFVSLVSFLLPSFIHHLQA